MSKQGVKHCIFLFIFILNAKSDKFWYKIIIYIIISTTLIKQIYLSKKRNINTQ